MRIDGRGICRFDSGDLGAEREDELGRVERVECQGSGRWRLGMIWC
jgi:hypothetical protein